MMGGDPSRNMYCPATGVTLDFDLRKGTNVAWTASLGQSYGTPIVSGGKVFISSNNDTQYRPELGGDRGVLLCFDVQTGKFLWQLTRDKLEAGSSQDWPSQGICSTSAVEGDRLWIVTNRGELMCLDTEGFHDGENDGPTTDETNKNEMDADIIWSVDLIEEYGVIPHYMSASSPVIAGDLVCILSGNGVDASLTSIPNPQAPAFLAFQKSTGKLAWQKNPTTDKVLDGQWSSPAVGVVDGKTQIVFPGGDGWLYAYDSSGTELWRFDMNPKKTVYEPNGTGDRNIIVAAPVFYDNSVICAVGDDPEYGAAVGHLWRSRCNEAW